MREIKFNAWDSLEKQYIRFDEWLEEQDIEVDGEHVTHNEALAKFLDYHCGCDLLQYTGLKDKNGKEIFEGDIIKYGEWKNGSLEDEPEYEFIYKVQWNMLKWCLLAESYLVQMWQQMSISDIQNLNNDGCKARTMEVIGNIYENPELLEKKNANKRNEAKN